jgi:squalene monooxygenase
VNTSFDVAIIGAGPAGCVTALSFARRGANVLLLESQPSPKPRLAGEWLHPPGVEVLGQLGLGSLPGATEHPPGRGFVVFPDDDSPPIVLNYAGGGLGRTCEHQALVSALREAAASHPRVRFRGNANVSGIDGQKLRFHSDSGSTEITCAAPLIIGADGRSSFTRRCLGLGDDRTLLSYMAGVLLEDAELPLEGYGHVFLAGLGPMFVLRISPRHIRMCLDVPLRHRRATTDLDYLEEAYSPAMPEKLRPAFRKAIRSDALCWTSNQWRPRLHYGREGLVLVGDAVGHFHPLTAVGLTLGFMDGHCLAQCKDLLDYRQQRTAQSRVPELLAIGLHRVFTQDDEGTVALRQAVYRMWRDSAADRAGTMKLLSGQATQLGHFNRAFLKVVALAVKDVVQSTVATGHWRRSARTFRDFGGWLRWLAAQGAFALTGQARDSYNAHATHGESSDAAQKR